MDHDGAAIRVWDQEGLDGQGTVIKELQGINGYYLFTRLVAVGNRLFYNEARHLYVLDPAMGDSKAIHSPDVFQSDGNIYIYGLAYEESRFLIRSYYIHPAQVQGYQRYDTTYELSWDEPTYVWSEDNSTCTATPAWISDPACVESETASAASQVTTPATCEGKGTTTYTATFENAAFAQQTKDVEDVDALGHAWGEVTYEWSADGKTCTATRSCSVCEEVETETAPAVTEKVVRGDPGEYEAYFYNAAAFTNPAFGTRQFLWGDATGDGKVDNKDVVRLKNYVANLDDETGISSNGTTVYTLAPGADANGDGVINNKDIVRLKNYTANYDETTGVATNGTTVYILGPGKTN